MAFCCAETKAERQKAQSWNSPTTSAFIMMACQIVNKHKQQQILTYIYL